jgi:tetratricopeptide (TPR) repeat protein
MSVDEEVKEAIFEMSGGDDTHAMMHLKHALRQDPLNRRALLTLNEILQKKHMYGEAIKHLEAYCHLKPEDTELYFELGLAYKADIPHDADNAERAREVFQEILARDKSFARAKVALQELPPPRPRVVRRDIGACFSHHDREADVRCVACGHWLCKECALPVPRDKRPLGAEEEEQMFICASCLDTMEHRTAASAGLYRPGAPKPDQPVQY